MTKSKMSREELRSSLSLALIVFFRILGLSLILPIFTLEAKTLNNTTPMLLGLAFGIYGLSQAVLQIPFGLLSDRFGRKPVIITGLLIFMVGSIIAGMATDIYTMILGRALQGAGAISAAVMALAADLTRAEHRTKAMALIGASVGVAFIIAFIMGPLLANYIGLSGIFYLTAGFALMAIFLLMVLVPTIETKKSSGPSPSLGSVLKNKALVGFDVGIFVLHMILMANFVAIPLIFTEQLGVESSGHWLIYFWVILISTFFLIPLIMVADHKNKGASLYCTMVLLLFLTEFILANWFESYWLMLTLLTVFFISFNFLEASLPSYVSKAADPENKGLALGVYASSQFLGAFVGATAGGYLLGAFGYQGIFVFCAFSVALWLMVTIYMYSDLKQVDLQT